MKNALLTAFLLIFTVSSKAQFFTGKVVDQDSVPIGYATVALLSDQDSTLIQGDITGKDGTFSLKVPENKPYKVQVSFVGYGTYTTESRPRDLGIILLRLQDMVLKEAVVKGNLPTHKTISGGITTRISNSVLSKVGTANDVIGHLPGIQKKIDGTFEVIGKGTPLIYINNRKIRDVSELRKLKSDEIQQIDLITNPGADYDAGTGAVLKIKTDRSSGEGFGIDVTSAVDYAYKTNTEQQINLNYQRRGWEISGAFRYALAHTKETAVTDIATHVDTLWNQSAQSTDRSKTQSLFGQLGINYTFNPRHSLGAMLELTSMPRYHVYNHNVTDVFADGKPYDVWNTYDTSAERTYPTYHANAYYTGTIGQLSVDFNADLLFGKNKEEEYVQERSTNYEDYITNTREWARNRLYAGKLVLSYPLGEGKLAAGSEYTYTHRRASSTGYDMVIDATDDKIEDKNLAFFLGYDGTWGIVNANAGLRYEHVIYDFYENGQFKADESKVYNNFFPTLSLNLPFGATRLALAYRIRTVRPAYEMLKSSTHYGNRLTYLSGTPDLQPTYIHSVELSDTYKSLRLAAGFNHYKDDIFFSIEQYAADPKVSINKFRNVSSRNEMVFSASFSPTIGFWKPEWTAFSNTQWLTVPVFDGFKELDGTAFRLKWGNAFTLPAGFLLRVDGNWDSTGYYQNKRLRSAGAVNASLYKELGLGEWSFLLEGNDLFHTLRDASFEYDKNTQEYRSTKDNTRQVKLTIRYRFNHRQSQYKGTGAGADERQRF